MRSDQLQKIKQARSNAKAKTESALARKEVKRARKAERVVDPESHGSMTFAAQKKDLGIVNGGDVYGWFRERHEAELGRDAIIGDWTVPQMALASKLLKTYGPDLVRRGVAWVFDNWSEIQKASRGNLGGRPTINVLWGFRETVFMELQAKKSGKSDPGSDPKNSDEFREKSGRPSIGW